MNHSRASRCAVGFLAAWALAAAPAASGQGAAEGARIADLERRLEHSLRVIEELSAKVDRLERAGRAPQDGAGQAGHEAKIEALERQVADLGAGLAHRGRAESAPLHGFADVGYVHSARSEPGGSGPKGFGVGSLNLYLTPRLGDRVKALVELVFEVEEDGQLLTDLERAQVGYTLGDAATIWLGRFHTPHGYWNTAFHHGAQIQTSLSRPRFLDFEDKGGILPAHLVGVWLQGAVPAGAGRLHYDVFAGNGSRIRFDSAARGVGSLELNVGGDDDHSATVGANLSYEFGHGLRLGGHWLRGNVRATDAAGATPAVSTRLQYVGPYLAYNDESWEWLAEAYRFSNRDLGNGGASHGSTAWFVQGARSFGSWTPYGRIEHARLSQADTYFARQESGRSYRRAAIGLRYDLNDGAALKLELNRTRVEAIPDGLGGTVDDAYGEMRMQYSIRF